MKTRKEGTPFIIHLFPNIKPINEVEEGIRQGHYDKFCRFISDKRMPLKTVEGAKNIYLVCFNRTIGETDYVELLRFEGLRPCRNAPQYLLGLMAAVAEDKMPFELRNRDPIAAEPDDSSSFFLGEGDNRCFLCVLRTDPHRELDRVIVKGGWGAVWAFLAEDLSPQTL